jgi:hypothetical protein
MRTVVSDETTTERSETTIDEDFARAAQERPGAIPSHCSVCDGRTTLLVAVPTPSCLVAYFACDNCALVRIVQR